MRDPEAAADSLAVACRDNPDVRAISTPTKTLTEMELLTLIPVIGFSLAWQRWQNTTAASAMLHSVSATLLILFGASLVGALLPVTVLLLACGVVLATVEGSRYVRQHIPLPVPIGLFAAFCVVYWLVHSESSYFYYDEYSHWGVFLKEILAQDQLWGADTNSMHPRYLPGTPLWQYFFAVFSKNQEGAAYLAQFALLLTPLLVLWEKTGWHRTNWHLGILALIIISVSNFGHGLTSLYVDHLLGIWFAGLLLNFLLEFRHRQVLQLSSYLLPLGVIVMIKSTGVFFALAASGILALLFLVHQRAGATVFPPSVRLRRALVFPVATIVLCVSILSAWNINRDSIGSGVDDTSTSSVVGRLIARESIFDTAQQAELSRRFIEVVVHQQISKDELSAQYNAFSYPLMPLFKESFRLTTASLLGLSLIAMFLLWRTIVPPDSRQSWAIVGGCVWLAAVAYIGILYLGYRYVSGNDHGLILSSYVRYAHSMLLPVVLFCFAPLVPAFAGDHTPPVKLGDNLDVGRHSIISSLSLLALLAFERPYLEPAYTTQRPPEIRMVTERMTSQLRDAIGDARLWILFPAVDSNGFLSHLLQYQLSPGSAYVEQDAMVLLGDHTALKSDLRNWEYMWFAVKGPELDSALERLIGEEAVERVFRIDASDDKITFEPVTGIFRTAGS